jgi:hypothetical protein
MMSESNVKIPLSLLSLTITLLESLDVSSCPHPTPRRYSTVLFMFRKKQQSLDLRQTYKKVIFAEDEDARLDAKTQYLKEKQEITDMKLSSDLWNRPTGR